MKSMPMGGDMGGKMPMMSPYLPQDKVMAMKQMMMTMEPDTLPASEERGKKLFNDTTLGMGKSGQSCASCHSEGGTVGGASEMEWKGMKMKVAIPTLKGAAAHFPKPMGPMKAVVTVAGMDNMCIMTFLKGMPLDLNSQAATDLEAYVTSFSVGRRLEPGAMKIVPTPVPGAM
jgi:cytochrome c